MLTGLKTTQSHVANPCAVRGEARELENTTSAHVFSPEPGATSTSGFWAKASEMPTGTNVTVVFLTTDLQKGEPALEKHPLCFFAQ